MLSVLRPPTATGGHITSPAATFSAPRHKKEAKARSIACYKAIPNVRQRPQEVTTATHGQRQRYLASRCSLNRPRSGGDAFVGAASSTTPFSMTTRGHLRSLSQDEDAGARETATVTASLPPRRRRRRPSLCGSSSCCRRVGDAPALAAVSRNPTSTTKRRQRRRAFRQGGRLRPCRPSGSCVLAAAAGTQLFSSKQQKLCLYCRRSGSAVVHSAVAPAATWSPLLRLILRLISGGDAVVIATSRAIPFSPMQEQCA